MSIATVDTIKNILIAEAKGKILASIFKKWALLSWGPFGWLTEFIVSEALEALAEQTELMIKIGYMRADINDKVQEVQDAIQGIREAQAKTETTQEEIDELDKKLAEAAFDLIHFNRDRLSNR